MMRISLLFYGNKNPARFSLGSGVGGVGYGSGKVALRLLVALMRMSLMIYENKNPIQASLGSGVGVWCGSAGSRRRR